jgi:hypothetical protein
MELRLYYTCFFYSILLNFRICVNNYERAIHTADVTRMNRVGGKYWLCNVSGG